MIGASSPLHRCVGAWSVERSDKPADVRFGPDIVGWRNVASVKEYMHAGLMHSVAFYVFSGGVMLLLSGTSPHPRLDIC